jgi:hypothetical protein
MFAILILTAAAVSLLDFVMIFSCPFISWVQDDKAKSKVWETYRVWSAISVGVGLVCLLLPFIMFMDYSRLAPDSHFDPRVRHSK